MAKHATVSGTGHLVSYPRFIVTCIGAATDGTLMFYVWMLLLTALSLVGINAWAHQVADGMVVTGMSDHVSWGLYIGNFTYMVGLAAGGVMMVIPAYVYEDRDTYDLVIMGEILAIAAILMSLMFVTADLGRPDRFWHMLPLVGKFNWPLSMLTWDVIALGGYLLINLHIAGYLTYMRFLGRKPKAKWYIPFVFLSIIWAVSIHTVTAFLYCGLGGRPFWNSALLAPRFLTSAFVTGPAFILLTMHLLRAFHPELKGAGARKTLVNILRVTAIINVFMLLSEVFTEFYSGGTHTAAAEYLYFGLGQANVLVPWAWTAIAFNCLGALMMLHPATLRRGGLLVAACVLLLVGVWVEKGMGLIVPGFVPSTLHEIVEYVPSLVEWKSTVGIVAFGLLVFTAGMKIALPALTSQTEEKEGTEPQTATGQEMP